MVFLLALLAQADPDLLYLEDRGISIRKIQLRADWDFRPKGWLKSSQIVLAHEEGLRIEIYHQDLDTTKVSYDAKYSLEQFWKTLPAGGEFKDIKLIKKIDYLTLPGRAASGARLWYLDLSCKLEDGSPLEWRRHCFVGLENRSGYFLDVLGPPGQSEKWKKDVDLILSSIRTYRIPKSKK